MRRSALGDPPAARTVPDRARDLATRLLATLWTAGVVAGIDTELPEICLRMAAQVVDGEDDEPP